VFVNIIVHRQTSPRGRQPLPVLLLPGHRV